MAGVHVAPSSSPAGLEPEADVCVGHGHRGTVHVRRDRETGRLVATKALRAGAPAHAMLHEAHFLALVNR